MTGSTSKRSLPTCTGFYRTEIKIQIQVMKIYSNLNYIDENSSHAPINSNDNYCIFYLTLSRAHVSGNNHTNHT